MVFGRTLMIPYYWQTPMILMKIPKARRATKIGRKSREVNVCYVDINIYSI